MANSREIGFRIAYRVSKKITKICRREVKKNYQEYLFKW
jgi:hypothetical protein